MSSIPLPSIPPPSVQEAALARIRQMLLTGELAPGAKINIDAMAEMFGVTAPPVREALKQLQAERVITWEPRRGYWVTKLSYDDFAEIQHITSLLEWEALRLGVPRLTDEDIETMEAMQAEMDRARQDDDFWTEIIAHREMHFVPYRSAGMPRLVEEIQRFWEHTEHYRVLYLYKDPAEQAVSLDQHFGIIAACRSRDADVAISLMKEHREFATSHIKSSMMISTG